MGAPHPEPKDQPRMFGPDSWDRPDAEAEPKPSPPAAPRPDLPLTVTAESLKSFCGEERMRLWREAAGPHQINQSPLFRSVAGYINEFKHRTALERHIDARGMAKNFLNDSIRAALAKAGTPDAPRPQLY